MACETDDRGSPPEFLAIPGFPVLPNRFVLKYTMALFRAPDGKSYEGEGLAPDIEVTQDEQAVARASRQKSSAERLAIDAQLRAAASFLRLR